MLTIDFKNASTADQINFLQHAVAPRPICFASTIDAKGNVNLSPFSFFNLFSYKPPIVVFSPVLRMRNASSKHTLDNVSAVPEVVINIVDYDMVQQTSLASCEYPQGTNEFIKAGFTEEKAAIIRPPMVKESKVKMECRVIDIYKLGENGGAGNLVICEVLCMHIDEKILDEKGMIDQTKLHHVARLGGDWYCHVNESNLFKVAKPNTSLGIGIDALPASIRTSSILSGNQLAQLANVHELPPIDPAFHDEKLRHIVQYYAHIPDEMEQELHRYAATLLNEAKVQDAWQVLLVGDEQ